MKKLLLLFILFINISCRDTEHPKYIFYFIGDGMGHNTMALTEALLASEQGDNVGFTALNFSQFPIVGLATSNSSNSRITDSAAAGTALASDNKTSNGTIGMNPEHTQSIESIAKAAKESGMRIGVATSVSIDHATPASFYANQPHRNMYHEIAMNMIDADFDLYAGSGFINPEPNDKPSVYDALSKAGYEITRGDNEITGKRAVMIQEEGAVESNLPLSIDATPSALTLPAITRRSIDFLLKDDGLKKGFLLTIESGQIDWAGHDNDAATMVEEVKDLDSAICVALEFYRKYPNETLIVVTADHETGGVSLGNKNKGYDSDFGLLSAQKCSVNALQSEIDNVTTWGDVKIILTEKMGFGTEVELTPEDWTQLESTYTEKPSQVAHKAVSILSNHAGVGWTTNAHTAAYVPIFAIGVSSEIFNGHMDNTQIASKLKSLIDLN